METRIYKSSDLQEAYNALATEHDELKPRHDQLKQMVTVYATSKKQMDKANCWIQRSINVPKDVCSLNKN